MRKNEKAMTHQASTKSNIIPKIPDNAAASLQQAEGALPYRMTNDYLFRAVFQSSPKALEGLCRSILHLSPEDTVSVTLQNPIELRETLDDREFILDLNVLINKTALMNLEMQMLNEGN